MAQVGLEADFWSGRRVLVTGHTGFKGSWLSLWLSAMKAKVAGFALEPPTTPSLFARANVADVLEDIRGDVRDFAAVSAALDKTRPEIVLHLAAQAVLRQSYELPLDTISVNVMGTANVLEATRQYNARCAAAGSAKPIRSLVIVTSDKCYENREWLWPYREIEPMGGHDPYSASKGCAELLVSAFSRSFGDPPTASARAGNVIGGGDWAPNRIIPDAVRAFSSGQRLDVRNPGAVRPWQHVLEPLSGYLLLAQRLYDGGPDIAQGWNFGPAAESEQTVRFLVDRIVSIWSDGACWQDTSGDNPHEAGLLKLDSSKAHARLGWRSRLDIEEALRLTISWYKADLARSTASMQDFTLGQIRDYCSV